MTSPLRINMKDRRRSIAGELLRDPDFRDRVIRYVLERKCQAGGFCFYKLEEPNGSDTFYALSILALMGIEFQDDKTLIQLRNMQHPDGSYNSVYMAYYSIKGLQMLREEPAYDPVPYVTKNLRHYRFDVEHLPIEISYLFKRTSYLVDLYYSLKMADSRIEQGIADFILYFENEDKGFGHRHSSLSETSRALIILSRLGYSVEKMESTAFIKNCEIPFYGFTDVPRTSLSYIEYVYAGIVASNIMSYQPHYLDDCANFILHCQNRNGGFSRLMHGGIATLENTYYAIDGLSVLASMI